ncbi:MAG: hypothetical protein Q9209_005233 [Squamulea sp. 1 TL-2023]
MDAIDPSIWGGLPLDVLCTVVESCDHETLISWSCTSVFFYNLASDLLWETLRINANEVNTSKHRDFARWISPENLKREHAMIVYFMTNNALRRRATRRTIGLPLIYNQMAKLPWLRVKRLRFDFQSSPYYVEKLFQGWYIAPVLHKVLHLMPQLQNLYFEGYLCKSVWDRLLTMRDLRDLSIRTGAEYVQRCTNNRLIKWANNQLLDLRRLAGLAHLKSLSIGRLAPLEAQGLAQAVLRLKLSGLYVCAGPPAQDDSDLRSIFAGTHGESPILTFLEAIMAGSYQQADSDAAPILLPETLKRLTLRDVYRSGQSTNDNMLLDTLHPCQSLTSLDICMMAPNQMQSFLRYAKFPVLGYFAIAGCRHFLYEGDWVHLGVHGVETKDAPPTVKLHTLALETFLLRHRYSLLTVAVSRPMPPSIACKNTVFRFDKHCLDHLWIAKSGIRLESTGRKNRYCDHWSNCHHKKGYCYAVNVAQRVTVQDLEQYRELLSGRL